MVPEAGSASPAEEAAVAFGEGLASSPSSAWRRSERRREATPRKPRSGEAAVASEAGSASLAEEALDAELELAPAAPPEENAALQQLRCAYGEGRWGPRGRWHGDHRNIAVGAGARGYEVAQQARQAVRRGERRNNKFP